MKLTERQRWEVMRAMVKQKNDEYSAFLLRFFDQKRMRALQGITRDTFLTKCALNSKAPLEDLEKKVKELGLKPASNWIDNLSSEDLLLFLDYRCRVLQQIYRHYKMYRNLNKEDVERIIGSTCVNELIYYNGGTIFPTGKPERAKGEPKVEELGLNNEQLVKEALGETMSSLAATYSQNQGYSIVKAQQRAMKLQTYNVDPNGYKIGYQFDGAIKLREPLSTPKLKMIDERRNITEPNMRLYGYDIKKRPVFIKGDILVDLFGNPTDEKNVIYDTSFVRFDEHISDDVKDKMVGLDIEGRPVYEDEQGYYNSLGERLPEDVYIQSEQLFNK